MRQRKSPEDFRLRWRIAREVKEALHPHGGPAGVGASDTIPSSHWYKAQAGDDTSVVYRFCCALLCLHNARADAAAERLMQFVELFYQDLVDGAGDDLDQLVELVEREMLEDGEADAATVRAALGRFNDPQFLETMARERREQASAGLLAARLAESRAVRLRAKSRDPGRLDGRAARLGVAGVTPARCTCGA